MSRHEKWSAIYVAIRSRLMQAVSHIVPPKDIEDIVQETYVRACQADAKNINCPQSYMFVTARNLALDHMKKAETRLRSDQNEGFDFDTLEFISRLDEPDQRLASNNEFAAFCEAVRQLPVKCRRTFVMKKVYGYSQKEIARILNISESTVEKHTATGIKRCLQYMKNQNHGENIVNSHALNKSQERKVVPMSKSKERK